jgi:hypothetical protein
MMPQCGMETHMRTHLFSLGLVALVLAACATSSHSPTEPQASGKLAKLSQSDLNATFADFPRDGGVAQVPSQATTDLDDVYVGQEDNAGGQFASNIGGTGNDAGIFFQDMVPSGNAHSDESTMIGGLTRSLTSDIPPVNLNQDIRGRFSGDAAKGAETEQDKIQRAGWIRLDVKKAIKFSSELRKLAATFGATVTSFKDNEVVWKMSGSKLDTLIDYFDARKDTEVLGYDFRSYDRTGDYYSVEARIKTAQQMIDRLNKLAEKAEKVEDLIKISEAIEHNMARVDALTSMLKEIDRRSGLLEVRIVLED